MSDKSSTDTLNLGETAPGFSLKGANRSDQYELNGLLQRGPVIVEFLRGTW